ncbi:MAG: hypothetical protein M3X11_10545, partial [Acidobacteriota bacterium]|nr:hypothetical protein [Acidobacteriota bacterium]
RNPGTVNHAVLLLGWDDSKKAWLLLNSWGTGWGEGGYMWLPGAATTSDCMLPGLKYNPILTQTHAQPARRCAHLLASQSLQADSLAGINRP